MASRWAPYPRLYCGIALGHSMCRANTGLPRAPTSSRRSLQTPSMSASRARRAFSGRSAPPTNAVSATWPSGALPGKRLEYGRWRLRMKQALLAAAGHERPEPVERVAHVRRVGSRRRPTRAGGTRSRRGPPAPATPCRPISRRARLPAGSAAGTTRSRFPRGTGRLRLPSHSTRQRAPARPRASERTSAFSVTDPSGRRAASASVSACSVRA